MISPFEAMQAAINIIHSSQHPTNKIAATIFHEKEGWSYSSTNQWPEEIAIKIGQNTKIGNSSGTVHAETSCLFTACFQHHHAIYESSLCISDPFCPNCAKNIAEAGVKTIYIDHKGFTKDFSLRRGDHFENMSMRIAEKAGINVYEINRKEERIVPICIAARDYHPANEMPVSIQPVTETFPLSAHNDHILEISPKFDDMKFTCCYAMDTKQAIYFLAAPAHPAIGFQSHQDIYEIAHPQGKYTFIQEPSNRLIMTAVKNGFQILNSEIYCSEVPTSRELVNIVGANIKHVIIEEIDAARDKFAHIALQVLTEKKILRVS